MSDEKKTEDTTLNLHWDSNSNSSEKIALKDLLGTSKSNNINLWPKVKDDKGWMPLPCYVKKHQICFSISISISISNPAIQKLFVEKGNDGCGALAVGKNVKHPRSLIVNLAKSLIVNPDVDVNPEVLHVVKC